MKKKVLLRVLIGFPIGIALGYLITIAVSLVLANGYYSPCVPELIDTVGNEINAVVLQALLCGILGSGFGAISLIWENESLNIVKQTGLYFLAASLIMLPVAYFTHWMEHSVTGFISYFGIFALIFAVIWIIMFVTGRHNVNKINKSLCKIKKG
ncbi:MAG: DUF3021 domain-containing protein [Ruminococcaceae bacterium]|nr:DUF3021 domain-containing protein [Oscillospiraceae bacterium]